ncbi:hypothetical protein TELCIR_05888, partial [Teladorsagia circumcincta]
IEPAFLRAQPFLWPLMAHVIAMSLVVWNPVLFFWLTRKQKRSGLSKIINSSETRLMQLTEDEFCILKVTADESHLVIESGEEH